ncbi:hypothetical protein B7486_25285 [cyanobacterium TDX16]|nr:hypothetical protein B7486_25285 [cyanobacterium TDX16]
MQAASISQGNAGNITIAAGDRISLSESAVASILALPSDELSNLIIGEIPPPQGDRLGGDIRISGRSLSLENRATINASTLGKGNAGSVFLRVDEAISLSGGNSFSSILSSVGSGGEGNGGTIDIEAGSLSLTNGGQIVSQVDPAANELPAGRGNGGKIIIHVRNAFSASGSSNDRLRSGVFTTVGAGVEGDGGTIDIEAGSLSLSDNGLLNASSNGQGNAGSIDVNVRTLDFDNGDIFAESTSGNGGNIRLRASKSVRLRQGSRISTSAGTEERQGNGGNITIDSPLVIANFNSNNDITANAFLGRGGRIEIDAQSIIGLTPRTRQELQLLLGTATPTAEDFLEALNDSRSNDVAAISVTDPALSGTVTFNAADIDPSRDLVELPTGLVDASTLVAAGCPSGAENRFAVTGRGGLPPAPGDKLSPDALLTDWASLQTPETQNRAAVESTIPETTQTTTTSVETIQEATSWQFDRDGKAILTTAPSATTRGYNSPTSCQGS